MYFWHDISRSTRRKHDTVRVTHFAQVDISTRKFWASLPRRRVIYTYAFEPRASHHKKDKQGRQLLMLAGRLVSDEASLAAAASEMSERVSCKWDDINVCVRCVCEITAANSNIRSHGQRRRQHELKTTIKWCYGSEQCSAVGCYGTYARKPTDSLVHRARVIYCSTPNWTLTINKIQENGFLQTMMYMRQWNTHNVREESVSPDTCTKCKNYKKRHSSAAWRSDTFLNTRLTRVQWQQSSDSQISGWCRWHIHRVCRGYPETHKNSGWALGRVWYPTISIYLVTNWLLNCTTGVFESFYCF